MQFLKVIPLLFLEPVPFSSKTNLDTVEERIKLFLFGIFVMLRAVVFCDDLTLLSTPVDPS